MSENCWYVLRDLKRANAKLRAWEILADKGFEVFTPLKWEICRQGGRRSRKLVPVIGDLLFVRGSHDSIEVEIRKTPTLQFRYVKNGGGQPLAVSGVDMQRFMDAVKNPDKVKYYTAADLNNVKIGKRVRIIGGALCGYEGKLLSVRGSRVKRLLIEIPELLTASVEIDPELIEIIE